MKARAFSNLTIMVTDVVVNCVKGPVNVLRAHVLQRQFIKGIFFI